MKRLLKLFIILSIPCMFLSAVGYQEPNFCIKQVYLTFDLDDTQTKVTSEMEFQRVGNNKKAPLVLDGENTNLISVYLNKKLLKENEYQLTENHLTLPNVSNHFHLTIVNEINPSDNTSLEGLYKSNDIFCTQNESKGFRKITYFLDRPDIMTKYTTKVIADKKTCPILLSNGNKIDSGELEGGKHFAVWQDPYKKPSYLFALVAGDVGCIEDVFIRKTGKPVDLKIFCEKGLEHKCYHAMRCLKRAMKWDEERFGLVCDLDTYMVVAINDFNAGAMENKGLNIFNSSAILANQETSTDYDFSRIEGVIGHEYFHNWTGNRVTLRDWYELNVKEALTVFRDQEFSLDMNARTKQRIENVAFLKRYQFSEDAGPTAHSIRPQEEIETRNLYSATVYCKGPEIIRMIQTLIGKETFKKGMDKYFELYDGQAVTTDQFVHAMELASNQDLSQFQRWYDQKGTPHLKVSKEYNAKLNTLTLYFEQSNPKEGSSALPLHIPLKIGLLDANGNDIALKNDLLEIREKKETFVFENIQSNPALSLNRDFSAPIIIEYERPSQDYAFLMANDSNEFNRWETARAFSLSTLQSLILEYQKGNELQVPQSYLDAFQSLLTNPSLDPALKAEAIQLPSESELAQTQEIIDFDANYAVRKWMKKKLASENEAYFLATYKSLESTSPYSIDPESKAKRELKNTCLYYLTSLEKQKYTDLCVAQFSNANNMTDQFTALTYLNLVNCEERKAALNQFYAQWKDDSLVINKWLSLQGASQSGDALNEVKALLNHPAYKITEPNKNRALLGGFLKNAIYFHAVDGSGYLFLEEQISTLDEINPHMASSLAQCFRLYPKLDPTRKQLMKTSLENLLKKEGLSSNTYEIINKSLNQE